jgi:hypothetical protein
MRRWLRENGLSLAFGLLFLLALGGQSVAGYLAERDEARRHGEQAPGYLSYVTSPAFFQAVMENWQSEYLQFALFILFSIWLVQRGSSESKEPGKEGVETLRDQQLGPYARPGSPWPARAGGWRTAVYSHSLLLVIAVVFTGSWLAQSVTGWADLNETLQEHGQPTVSWTSYLTDPSFWEATLQNWQSEFLAVGSMAIFTVYLRERGSHQSKPVGAPHSESASSG